MKKTFDRHTVITAYDNVHVNTNIFCLCVQNLKGYKSAAALWMSQFRKMQLMQSGVVRISTKRKTPRRRPYRLVRMIT